jgi:hypothetical protein
MSNLLEHAKRELLAAGYDPDQTEEDPNKWIQENILELIKVFAAQGHSGSSAPYCIRAFKTLANWEPLVPLTGEDGEWGPSPSGHGPDQNIRCSRVFRNPDGRAFDVSGKVFREPSGACYTGSGSAVDVTFPYTPKTEYVDVPAEERD